MLRTESIRILHGAASRITKPTSETEKKHRHLQATMTDQQPVTLSGDQFTQLLQRLSTNTGATGASKSVKPVRPSVDVETAEGEWSIFLDQWARFKRMASLATPLEINDNLRQCCSDQLNRRLFDIRGASALNNSLFKQR